MCGPSRPCASPFASKRSDFTNVSAEPRPLLSLPSFPLWPTALPLPRLDAPSHQGQHPQALAVAHLPRQFGREDERQGFLCRSLRVGISFSLLCFTHLLRVPCFNQPWVLASTFDAPDSRFPFAVSFSRSYKLLAESDDGIQVLKDMELCLFGGSPCEFYSLSRSRQKIERDFALASNRPRRARRPPRISRSPPRWSLRTHRAWTGQWAISFCLLSEAGASMNAA